MENSQKKPVSSSHLALRFHKSAGWTKEILEDYLIRGKLVDTAERHGDDPDMAYFLLDQGAAFDVERLLAEQISVVHRWYDGPPRETDLEYLQHMNW